MSASTPQRLTRARCSGQQDRGLPSLLYGEAEEELRAAVRDLFQERADWSAVLARTETSEPYDSALWRTLAAEVGCGGLLIPESHGGAGASYREAAVVAEEAGPGGGPRPVPGQRGGRHGRGAGGRRRGTAVRAGRGDRDRRAGRSVRQ